MAESVSKKNKHQSGTAISSLTPDPRNARKHDPRNIQAIADSLSRFGQRKPIVVADGIVIAGNGTLEAAKSLGWTHIETVDASDLSVSDRRAYAIADNRTAELAEWDDAALAEQLNDLAADGVDLDSLAFDEREMDALAATEEASLPDNLAEADKPFVGLTIQVPAESRAEIESALRDAADGEVREGMSVFSVGLLKLCGVE